MKEVYDNYDFLRRLTEKRYPDVVMGDEAFSYAFEGLAKNDWKRVRAYKGKSSFRTYLGCIWCRLLEDFSVKKFGRITPPKWIQNLGSIWEELFKLLCRRRLSTEESVEKIIGEGRYVWDEKDLEKAADEILGKIPNCGEKKGPAFSIDDEQAEASTSSVFNVISTNPDKITIQKEKWLALQALAKVCFKQTGEESGDNTDTEKLAALIIKIRKRLHLNEKEQLILNTHFVDGQSITDIGKRLGVNTNQIHGQFRRLMAKIKKTLPELLDSYV